MAGKVRVLPSDVLIEVEDGETLFRAARRQGYSWPSICNGDCECGICYMVVEEGADQLSEKQQVEADRLALGLKAKEPRARLACQAKVNGDAVVTRRGVNAAE